MQNWKNKKAPTLQKWKAFMKKYWKDNVGGEQQRETISQVIEPNLRSSVDWVELQNHPTSIHTNHEIWYLEEIMTMKYVEMCCIQTLTH